MPAPPPELQGTHVADSPLDRALEMMLAGERDSALRWSAAVVKDDPSIASALLITARLLADAARTDAATEAFELAVDRAIDAGNLPLAVAAAHDLGKLGRDSSALLDSIAKAFCADSPRLGDASLPPPPLNSGDDLQPLSSVLTGPALLSKVTEIVHDAKRAYADEANLEDPLIAPLPLFSALKYEGLRALIASFEMKTVPAGEIVIEEGSEGSEAFIVARGELEVRKHSENPDEPDMTMARLTGGALFGEMALLARAPRYASVVACRPSILLVADRFELEKVARKRPDVGSELAAHCRRRMVANLVRTSPVLLAVDPEERPALVERFETRVFEKGERLTVEGAEPTGFHLIASGEVSVVKRENGEPFVIATLGPGHVVGEVALVLRRQASADLVAVHPTVTLHLPRGEFLALIREHPGILLRLYLLAVERDEETAMIIENAVTAVGDDLILV
ncbi:MAG: cyclic nucleotide-binding domain-containing protein [Polyangiaceae bacterium]